MEYLVTMEWVIKNMSYPGLEILLRLLATFQIFMALPGILRTPVKRDSRNLLLLFILSILGATIGPLFEPNQLLRIFLGIGAPATTAILPFLSTSFFSEKRIKPIPMLLVFLVHPIATYGWLVLFFRRPEYESLAILPALVLGAGFSLAAVWIAAREYETDLMDERRSMRLQFSLSTVTGIVLQLLFRAMDHTGTGISALAEPAMVLIVVVYIQAMGFKLDEGILPAQDYHRQPQTLENRPMDLADSNIVNLLKTKMELEKVYRLDGLTIRSLAEMMGIKEYRVRRTIRALGYGRFSEYLNEKRVEEACQRLEDGSQSDTAIVRIALDCGFSSAAAFNRSFRDQLGITPGEYRKNRIQDKGEKPSQF